MSDSEESVYQLMSTPIVSIDPRTHVGEAMALSETLGIHHFPLVGAEGLFGMVCTCDLEGARPEQAVSQFAHRHTVMVKPNSTAYDAAARMLTYGVGSVVVADDEGLWGIITREDLAETTPELMLHAHCSACRTRQHLRRDPNGAYLCAKCRARANADPAASDE